MRRLACEREAHATACQRHQQRRRIQRNGGGEAREGFRRFGGPRRRPCPVAACECPARVTWDAALAGQFSVARCQRKLTHENARKLLNYIAFSERTTLKSSGNSPVFALDRGNSRRLDRGTLCSFMTMAALVRRTATDVADRTCQMFVSLGNRLRSELRYSDGPTNRRTSWPFPTQRLVIMFSVLPESAAQSAESPPPRWTMLPA